MLISVYTILGRLGLSLTSPNFPAVSIPESYFTMFHQVNANLTDSFMKQLYPNETEPNPPPDIGLSAAPKMPVKALPPALRTPDVLELLDTKTARIATPITAVRTVTTEVIN